MLSFFPRKKVQTLKEKLNGYNPARILAGELKDSRHARQKYYKQLLKVIQGPEGSVRKASLDKEVDTYLSAQNQVDCLVEMARDPDILGRVWIGWGAYI